MAFMVDGVQYLSLREWIGRQTQSGLYTEDGSPLYAHPADKRIVTMLNATPVKAVLEDAINGLTEMQFGEMLASSVPISAHSFSDIFESLTACAKTLGIAVPYAVARAEANFHTAYTGGTDGGAFILVSTSILDHFSPDSIRFILGHECGHIAADHTAYKVAVDALAHTVLPLLGPVGLTLQKVASYPLLAWSRCAEITADRAGLLCCRNLSAAERCLVGLVTGTLEDKVDINEYVRTSRENAQGSSLRIVHSMLRSHPMIPQRIEALRLFACSEMYYRLTNEPTPPRVKLLSDADLRYRTATLIN